MKCIYCQEEIELSAKKCKTCGSRVDTAIMLACLIVFLACDSKHQIKYGGWKEEQLTGKVRVVEQRRYEAGVNGDSIFTGKQLSLLEPYNWNLTFPFTFYTVSHFDTSGNKIERVEYNSKGFVIWRETYNYNSDQGVVEKMEWTTGIRHILKYDKDGKLSEDRMYEPWPPDVIVIGRSHGKDTLFPGPTRKYTYDDVGNRLDPWGRLTKFNQEGKRVAVFDSVGQLLTTWEYDSTGIMIGLRDYDNETLAWDFKYTYEYDDVGNWIKRIEFDKGEPKSITVRSIKYY